MTRKRAEGVAVLNKDKNVNDLTEKVAQAVAKIFGGNPTVIDNQIVVRQCEYCGSWNTTVEYPSEGLPAGWAFMNCNDCPVGTPFVLGEKVE